MDYKKEYEEMVQRVKELHEAGNFLTKKQMEIICPELAESEDERIRKELKEAFEAYDIESTWNGIPIRSIFDWLEKQKEQKPDEIDGKALLHVSNKSYNIGFRDGVDSVKPVEGEFPYNTPVDTLEGEIENIWSKLSCENKFTATKTGFREVILHFVDYVRSNAAQKQKEQKPIKVLYIPKFRTGDLVRSSKNPRLTYEILGVGSMNELGNPEYEVEIFTDGKPDEPRNLKHIEIEKMDSWGELVKQKPVEINEYEIIKKHITEDSLSSEVNKRLKECGWYVTDERPAESTSRLTVQGKGVYKICPRCKERMVRDDSKVYTSMPPQYGYECPKCGEMEFDTVMYDSPEMEKQKPDEIDGKALLHVSNKSYDIGFRDGVASVKPAEYLNKDMVYAIMKKLHDLAFSQDILINSKEYKQIDEITHDVRSLLDYPIDQQPAEWSEEDEHRITDAIYFLESAKIHYADTSEIEKTITFLKSLRPVSKESLQSWKPSEEQDSKNSK